MADKTRGKSRRRSDVARKFIALGGLEGNLPADWSFKGFLIGFLLVVLTTAVLMDYQFQTFTDYQVGEIADRTIEASQDFTVEDHEATAVKLAEVRIEPGGEEYRMTLSPQVPREDYAVPITEMF